MSNESARRREKIEDLIEAANSRNAGGPAGVQKLMTAQVLATLELTDATIAAGFGAYAADQEGRTTLEAEPGLPFPDTEEQLVSAPVVAFDEPITEVKLRILGNGRVDILDEKAEGGARFVTLFAGFKQATVEHILSGDEGGLYEPEKTSTEHLLESLDPDDEIEIEADDATGDPDEDFGPSPAELARKAVQKPKGKKR